MAAELRLFRDLDSAAANAGSKLSRGARPSLFDRLDWFRLVDRYTRQGRTLVVQGSKEAAGAWLFLSVQGRSAEALGNWYSVRWGPVTESAPGTAPPLHKLVQGLRRAGVGHLFLEPMDDPEPLAQVLRRHGWVTSVSPINVSWRVDTRGIRFAEYWASRPNNLRRGVERRARKKQLQCVIYDRFEGQAWRDYEAVYAASWKPAEGSPAFLRRLAEQEGAAGTLRLGIAYHEGQAVAAEVWLVENGFATIHKSAYREDARELGAGNILRLELFRRALDVEGVETIDFGVGDQPYKADWTDYKVPLYALSAYDLLRPHGIAGVARAAIRKLVPGSRTD